MSDLDRFNKLRRRWYWEMLFTLVSLAMMIVLYFSNGKTNSLVIWSVFFLWGNREADRLHDEIMKLGSPTNNGKVG